MALSTLRVLLLEDHVSDADLILHELRRAGFEPVWERVDSEPDYILSLARPFDLILADHALPQFDALRALDILRELAPEIPFLIVSGTIDEEVAIEAMKRGAADYLLKDRLARLGPAVCQAIERNRLREARDHSIRALRHSDARKAAILDTALDAIITIDGCGNVVEFNTAAERIFGYRRDEAIGHQMAELIIPPSLRSAHRAAFAAQVSSDPAKILGRRLETKALRADGTEFDVELGVTRIPPQHSDDLPLYTGYVRDITETKSAQRRLNAQHAVARALAEARPLDDAIRLTLEAVCENLGGICAALWQVEQGELRCLHTWGLAAHARSAEFAIASRRMPLRKGVGLPGRVWATGDPAWISDLAADANFPRSSAARAAGLDWAIAVPIRISGEVIAVMEFFGAKPRQYDEQWLSVVATIGTLVGHYMERVRAAESLREKTEQLRALVESLDELVFEFDRDGMYLNVWTESESLLVLPKCELIGRTVPDVLGEGLGSPFVDAFRRVIAGGRAESLEYSLEVGRGKRWFLARISPISTADGSCNSVCFLSRDITDRKQAEEALRRSEASLASAQRLALVGSWRFDIERDRITWSDELFRLCGLAPGGMEPSLEAFLSRVHPEDRAWVMERISAARQDHRSFSYDLRMVLPDGGVRVHHVRGQVTVSATGQPVEIVGTAQDITERKHREEIERERDSLRDAMRSHERILGVVGHELRTPLAAVRAMAEFLLDHGSSEPGEASNFLECIHGEVIRMSGIVNDLLEVARLNSGMAKWDWSDVFLATTCEEVLSSMRPLVDTEKVSLRHNVEPNDLMMRGDGGAIRRLVLNLVSNASKFTLTGSIEVNVARCTTTTTEGFIQIDVRDTGKGMAPETAERLGEPFALNSGVVGDSYVKGSGLGLAICKGIVAAHGGTISVASTPGHGTTVTVLLRSDLAEPALDGLQAASIKKVAA